MSYSFTINAKDASAAKDQVADKLDEVVIGQPIHALDRNAHEKIAGEMIDLLGDPEDGKVIAGSIAGSCFTRDGGRLDGVSINVSLNFALKTD